MGPKELERRISGCLSFCAFTLVHSLLSKRRTVAMISVAKYLLPGLNRNDFLQAVDEGCRAAALKRCLTSAKFLRSAGSFIVVNMTKASGTVETFCHGCGYIPFASLVASHFGTLLKCFELRLLVCARAMRVFVWLKQCLH